MMFQTNSLKGMYESYFQGVETRALSTRGRADVGLHHLTAERLRHGGRIAAAISVAVNRGGDTRSTDAGACEARASSRTRPRRSGGGAVVHFRCTQAFAARPMMTADGSHAGAHGDVSATGGDGCKQHRRREVFIYASTPSVPLDGRCSTTRAGAAMQWAQRGHAGMARLMHQHRGKLMAATACHMFRGKWRSNQNV